MSAPATAAPVPTPTSNTNTNAPTAAMGAKALLAKRMAKSANPSFVSPTDNMMTPVSQKLNATKKGHFTKGAKPMPQLFSQATDSSQSKPANPSVDDDDENPF